MRVTWRCSRARLPYPNQNPTIANQWNIRNHSRSSSTERFQPSDKKGANESEMKKNCVKLRPDIHRKFLLINPNPNLLPLQWTVWSGEVCIVSLLPKSNERMTDRRGVNSESVGLGYFTILLLPPHPHHSPISVLSRIVGAEVGLSVSETTLWTSWSFISGFQFLSLQISFKKSFHLGNFRNSLTEGWVGLKIIPNIIERNSPLFEFKWTQAESLLRRFATIERTWKATMGLPLLLPQLLNGMLESMNIFLFCHKAKMWEWTDQMDTTCNRHGDTMWKANFSRFLQLMTTPESIKNGTWRSWKFFFTITTRIWFVVLLDWRIQLHSSK